MIKDEQLYVNYILKLNSRMEEFTHVLWKKGEIYYLEIQELREVMILVCIGGYVEPVSEEIDEYRKRWEKFFKK